MRAKSKGGARPPTVRKQPRGLGAGMLEKLKKA